MKNRLTLLFASTALTVAIGLPALAGMHAQARATAICGLAACAADFGDGEQDMRLIRVSDDDDDDDDGRDRRGRDDDDDDDDDCDDDDDDDCSGAGGNSRVNPAPAGTVAPPANGLFGNGAPPVAVTN